MAKVKIVLDTAGVKELLRSDEAMNICDDIGNNALKSLGEGYEVNTQKGRNRAITEVKAVYRQTIADNSQNNTILKALGGGGN